jgi:hypothetical protein
MDDPPGGRHSRALLAVVLAGGLLIQPVKPYGANSERKKARRQGWKRAK